MTPGDEEVVNSQPRRVLPYFLKHREEISYPEKRQDTSFQKCSAKIYPPWYYSTEFYHYCSKMKKKKKLELN